MADKYIEIKADNRAAVKAALQKQILIGLEKCGMAGEGYAKDNLTQKGHVDTGNLRNSVAYKIDSAEPAAYIGTNVEYGKYIETGTGEYVAGGRQTAWSWQDDNGNWHRTTGMKPDPWLKPAVSEHLDVYREIMKNALL